jgi:hypothetical protein
MLPPPAIQLLIDEDIQYADLRVSDNLDPASGARAVPFGHRLLLFAEDSRGGRYGLWVRPLHKDLSEAPVVRLRSDGSLEACALRADLFLELAVQGLVGAIGDLHQAQVDPDFLEEWQEMATMVLGRTPRSPQEIAQETAENWPDGLSLRTEA